MIFLGLTAAEKDMEVSRYCIEHGCSKVFMISPARFRVSLTVDHEWIGYPQHIEYVNFYHMMRDVDRSSLIVINECLRTQNRYALEYNCIRNFLLQTSHQLIFQRLPLIDTWADFAILFDFDTRSRWKRELVDGHLEDVCVDVRRDLTPMFHPIEVSASPRTHALYEVERERLFSELGLRDPHTLPRNLHLVGGKTKLLRVDEMQQYVGRNNRFNLSNLCTYRETESRSGLRIVFEWCHNFIDFADFLACTGQIDIDVLTTDMKVDCWYLQRYQGWAGRIRDAYATLHG